MKIELTPVQMHVLRRCSGGLRVWETGPQQTQLLSRVNELLWLRLVEHDVNRGYETTPAGEAWLTKFGE